MQPEPKPPVKVPGQGFAKAGVTFGVIGLALVILFGLIFATTNFEYYDASDYNTDLIMHGIGVIMPLLGIVFGIVSKRKKCSKKSAHVAVILGSIGAALSVLILAVSTVMTFLV